MADSLCKAGTLLLMHGGDMEHGEYTVHGLCTALVDFNMPSVVQEYLTANPECRRRYDFSPSALKDFMIGRGYIRDAEHREIDVGDEWSWGQVRLI